MPRPRLIALLLALVTLVVYLPVMRNGFVNFDDGDYIVKNPVVQAGWTWPGVKWAFTTTCANNWHPLTWLSHMTDCQFFKLNPAGHHFVNALIHALNSGLVFLFLLRLTGKSWASLFMAALFAWHPAHVESVAWASERKDTLSTFFALLALLSYTRYARSKVANREPNTGTLDGRRPTLDYWAAFMFLTLGLLAKPMLVTLPFVFLLLDFWPLKRFSVAGFKIPDFSRLLIEKIPFFILIAASCVTTFLVQSHEFHGHAAVAPLQSFRLDFRFGNLPLALAGYIAELFWPVNLCVFYPLPAIYVIPKVAGTALLVITISIVAWRWRMTRPYFLMGWLWFTGTLMPVIGIVQVGSQAMADRYTYIPSIGFFLAVMLLVGEAVEKIRLSRKVIAILGGLVCATCIFGTEHQIRTWEDSETLFRQATEVVDSDTSRINLGAALEEKNRLEEAAEQYVAGLELNPRRPELYNNLAHVLDLLNRPAGALAAYRAALKVVPQDASQLTGAGYELERLGRYDEALAELAIATNIAPLYAAPHIQAAHIFYKTGRDPEGAAEILFAARLKSHDWQLLADAAHYLAADENAAARNGAAAVQLALRADDLTGGKAPFITDTLAMAFAEAGDFTNAIAAEQHAITTAQAAHMTDLEPLQHRLELFQNHQPWRENFRPADAAH